MQEESGIIEREGYGLRFCSEGRGLETLVIGSALYYPKTFSATLRNHLHMVFIDHRVFALPPKNARSDLIELDVILDDIEYMREKVGLKQVAVIGHSGHGYMALEYAKKYPQWVSHVVLIGHGPDHSLKSQKRAEHYWQEAASPERKKALEKKLQHFSQEHMQALNPSQQFIMQYVLNGARIWFDYHFDSSPLWEKVEINMPLFTHVWGTLFRDIDITKGLETFNKPVFLALGQYDFLIDRKTWDPILEKFQNIEVHLFEKSGHTPQYEEPTLFDQKLLKWLRIESTIDSPWR